MLVLRRKASESLILKSLTFAGEIKVTVLETTGRVVKLGIEAPEHVKVYRDELQAPSLPPDQQNTSKM